MSKASDDLLQIRIDQLKGHLRILNDPKRIADCCGMDYSEFQSEPVYNLSFFNKPVEIKFPELILRDSLKKNTLGIAYQALGCYYMHTSVTNPAIRSAHNKWISFADLPDGRFYNQAFQGYTGDMLVPRIEVDLARFKKIALLNKGRNLEMGDVAFEFSALPKVSIAIVYWQGDEEFSSSCKLLFNDSVRFHLPTDACAILGSILTQMLLKQFTALET